MSRKAHDTEYNIGVYNRRLFSEDLNLKYEPDVTWHVGKIFFLYSWYRTFFHILPLGHQLHTKRLFSTPHPQKRRLDNRLRIYTSYYNDYVIFSCIILVPWNTTVRPQMGLGKRDQAQTSSEHAFLMSKQNVRAANAMSGWFIILIESSNQENLSAVLLPTLYEAMSFSSSRKTSCEHHMIRSGYDTLSTPGLDITSTSLTLVQEPPSYKTKFLCGTSYFEAFRNFIQTRVMLF